jgi:mannose-6-phosphate isomerase-like protein (cupin superfamily)
MADADTAPGTCDLHTTFLHLADTAVVTPLTVGPDFWSNMPPILSTGRMVSILAHDADWRAWEKHPAGDEVIVQLSGRMRLRLELPQGEALVDLPAGRCVVVKRDVWHTADVLEAGAALYITEGQGTQHRPR